VLLEQIEHLRGIAGLDLQSDVRRGFLQLADNPRHDVLASRSRSPNAQAGLSPFPKALERFFGCIQGCQRRLNLRPELLASLVEQKLFSGPLKDPAAKLGFQSVE